MQGIAYGCYCTGLWSSFEESNRVDKQLLSAIETDCDIFVSKDERLSNLAAAGSVAIVVFNFILEVLLKSLARYERHHTGEICRQGCRGQLVTCLSGTARQPRQSSRACGAVLPDVGQEQHLRSRPWPLSQ